MKEKYHQFDTREKSHSHHIVWHCSACIKTVLEKENKLLREADLSAISI